MTKWSSSVSDPRADKAGDSMRRFRAKLQSARIAKHRKGECAQILPYQWDKRIDSSFYEALEKSPKDVQQEVYWLWEELDVMADSLLTTFSDAQATESERKRKREEPRPFGSITSADSSPLLGKAKY